MISDEILKFFGTQEASEILTLESVAAVACEDVELLFIAYTRSAYLDIGVMHEIDSRSGKDPDIGIACQI